MGYKLRDEDIGNIIKVDISKDKAGIDYKLPSNDYLSKVSKVTDTKESQLRTNISTLVHILLGDTCKDISKDKQQLYRHLSNQDIFINMLSDLDYIQSCDKQRVKDNKPKTPIVPREE